MSQTKIDDDENMIWNHSTGWNLRSAEWVRKTEHPATSGEKKILFTHLTIVFFFFLNATILNNSEIPSVKHSITLTWCVVFTYVLMQVWWEASLLRRWAADLTTSPESWWWETFSLLGSGRHPANPIPPPAVCSACFCPGGPFRKTPPTDHNA